MRTRILVVMIVERLTDALFPAFHQTSHRLSLNIGGNRHVGVIEKRRREVDIGDDRVIHAAGFDLSRVSQQQWHSNTLLVHESLVEPAVIAEKEAVVRGVDDDGVLGEIVPVEPIKQTPDVVIHRGDHAQVVFDEPLIFPLLDLLFAEAGWRVALGVCFGQILHRHGLFAGGPAASAIVVVEGRGQRQILLVHLRVLFVRDPRSMWGFLVKHQAERPGLVSFLHPVDGHIGDDVGGVAVDGLAFAVFDKDGVPVGALANEDRPVIETRGVGLQVPLANDRGLIPGRLKHLGKRRLRAVELVAAVAAESMDVAVFSGQHAGPAGPTDGVG